MADAIDTQSRKWTLTINNPAVCDLDHSRIVELLQLFKPDYFCLADEIATTGTYHTHIYLYSKSPMRFRTIKRRFRPLTLKRLRIRAGKPGLHPQRGQMGGNGKGRDPRC